MTGGLEASYSIYLDLGQVNGIGANYSPDSLAIDSKDNIYFRLNKDTYYKLIDPTLGPVTNTSSPAIEAVVSNAGNLENLAFNVKMRCTLELTLI